MQRFEFFTLTALCQQLIDEVRMKKLKLSSFE
jgi:hypothetical protein